LKGKADIEQVQKIETKFKKELDKNNQKFNLIDQEISNIKQEQREQAAQIKQEMQNVKNELQNNTNLNKQEKEALRADLERKYQQLKNVVDNGATKQDLVKVQKEFEAKFANIKTLTKQEVEEIVNEKNNSLKNLFAEQIKQQLEEQKIYLQKECDNKFAGKAELATLKDQLLRQYNAQAKSIEQLLKDGQVSADIINTLQRQLQDIPNQIKNLTNDAKQNEKIIQGLTNAIAAQNQATQDLAKELKGKADIEQVQKIETKFKKELDKNNQKFNLIDQEISNIKQEQDALQSNVRTLALDVKDNIKTLQEQAQLTQLRIDNAIIAKKESDLEIKNKLHENAIYLNQLQSKANQDINNLNEKQNEVNNKMMQLNAEKDKSKKDLGLLMQLQLAEAELKREEVELKREEVKLQILKQEEAERLSQENNKIIMEQKRKDDELRKEKERLEEIKQQQYQQMFAYNYNADSNSVNNNTNNQPAVTFNPNAVKENYKCVNSIISLLTKHKEVYEQKLKNSKVNQKSLRVIQFDKELEANKKEYIDVLHKIASTAFQIFHIPEINRIVASGISIIKFGNDSEKFQSTYKDVIQSIEQNLSKFGIKEGFQWFNESVINSLATNPEQTEEELIKAYNTFIEKKKAEIVKSLKSKRTGDGKTAFEMLDQEYRFFPNGEKLDENILIGDEFRDKIINAMKKHGDQSSIVAIAPAGSGKTVTMGQILKYIAKKNVLEECDLKHEVIKVDWNTLKGMSGGLVGNREIVAKEIEEYYNLCLQLGKRPYFFMDEFHLGFQGEKKDDYENILFKMIKPLMTTPDEKPPLAFIGLTTEQEYAYVEKVLNADPAIQRRVGPPMIMPLLTRKLLQDDFTKKIENTYGISTEDAIDLFKSVVLVGETLRVDSRPNSFKLILDKLKEYYFQKNSQHRSVLEKYAKVSTNLANQRKQESNSEVDKNMLISLEGEFQEAKEKLKKLKLEKLNIEDILVCLFGKQFSKQGREIEFPSDLMKELKAANIGYDKLVQFYKTQNIDFTDNNEDDKMMQDVRSNMENQLLREFKLQQDCKKKEDEEIKKQKEDEIKALQNTQEQLINVQLQHYQQKISDGKNEHSKNEQFITLFTQMLENLSNQNNKISQDQIRFLNKMLENLSNQNNKTSQDQIRFLNDIIGEKHKTDQKRIEELLLQIIEKVHDPVGLQNDDRLRGQLEELITNTLRFNGVTGRTENKKILQLRKEGFLKGANIYASGYAIDRENSKKFKKLTKQPDKVSPQSKTNAVTKQQSQSVIKPQSQSEIKQQTNAVTKQQSQSVIKQQTNAVTKQQSQSVIKPQSQSEIKQQPQSEITDNKQINAVQPQSQSIIKQQSQSVITYNKQTNAVQPQSQSVIKNSQFLKEAKHNDYLKSNPIFTNTNAYTNKKNNNAINLSQVKLPTHSQVIFQNSFKAIHPVLPKDVISRLQSLIEKQKEEGKMIEKQKEEGKMIEKKKNEGSEKINKTF